MGWGEIFMEQFFDPFRAGLLLFLVITARNTAATTGMALPLLAGIAFVAVLIPLSFSSDAANWWQLVAAGLVTNVVIVALLVAIARLIFPVARADGDGAQR